MKPHLRKKEGGVEEKAEEETRGTSLKPLVKALFLKGSSHSLMVLARGTELKTYRFQGPVLQI